MATQRPSSDGSESTLRHCATCGGEREHHISVAVDERSVRDGVREENLKFCRVPVRVYRCFYCDRSTRERAV